MTLTLKDFLRETLTQIVDGVDEFQEGKDVGVVQVFPSIHRKSVETPGLVQIGVKQDGEKTKDIGHGYGQTKIAVNKRTRYACMIDFDIAVTAESSDNAKFGGGIKVVGMHLGGDTSGENKNSNISRVKFSIPVEFKGN